MTQGPRDWNPPGYWDEPPRPPHQAAAATTGLATQRSTSHLKGLLAVLFGLASSWLPLSLPRKGLDTGDGCLQRLVSLPSDGRSQPSEQGPLVASRLACCLFWGNAWGYRHNSVPAATSHPTPTKQGSPLRSRKQHNPNDTVSKKRGQGPFSPSRRKKMQQI